MRIEAMRNMLLHYAWNKDNGCSPGGGLHRQAVLLRERQHRGGSRPPDPGRHRFCGSRVSRIYRDLRITRISGGTGEIQTVIAARQVLKKYR